MDIRNDRNTVFICIDNENFGDGDFTLEVEKTLLEYIEMGRAGLATNRGFETYMGPRGTKMTVIAGHPYETRIPYSTDKPHQQNLS